MSLERRQVYTRLCRIFCTLLSLVLLWRWQRIFYLMCADYIISDMPAHIRLAMEHSDYGLSSYLIRFLWALGGDHFGRTALSLLLAANQAAGLFTLWLLIRRVLPELDGCAAFLAALLAHLCGPWIVPGQTGMYLGVYNGNVYHNMTVLFSRTFIPLDLLFFFRLWDARAGRLPRRDWLGLALCFLLTTLFKPSYAFAFLPVLALLLLGDLLRSRGRNLKNEILIGLAVVPAGLACIWQYLVLFSADFDGTSSGVALRALSVPLLLGLGLMYLRGLLLPLYSFLRQGRREEKRGWLRLFAAINAAAIAEAVLLTETGFRANDGNFDWGSLALYPAVFGLGIGLLFRMLRTAQPRCRRDRLRLLLGLILLLGHLIVGVYCLHRPGHAGYEWFYF